MHVKKGDTVIVIAGNDKGKVGEVQRVQREAGRVVVAGVNLRWKHRRATQKNPKGERVQEEFPIHHSNVLPYDSQAGKGTRKRARTEAKR